MRREITVGEILKPDLLYCSPDTPIAEAAARMVEAQCGSILVAVEGRMIGIWTEQDALALEIADSGDYRMPISRLMSSPLKTIAVDATIGEAASRFREDGVRHLLVVAPSGEHRGIVSQSDVVINQGIEYFVSLRELDSVFRRRHEALPGTLSIRDAVRTMHENGLDAAIVCGADGYGILTQRDVVRLVASGRSCATVAELATYPLVSLPLNTSLYHARKVFTERRIRHVGVTDAAGELVGLVAFADILANIEHEYVRRLREALRESEATVAASARRLRLAAKAFESTFEGILVTSAEQIIESVNPAFTRITGYAAEDVLGKKPTILSSGRHDAAFYQAMFESIAQTDHWQGEICNRRKNGEIYVEWLTINAIRDDDGRVTNYVAVFTDFTSRKAAEENMRYLAQHDALTGLPNRSLLTQRLLRAIRHARRNRKKVAVIFLDLDRFKAVNDSFGHAAGDKMLKVVAQRLTDSVRAEDTVARLGGDEFILLLEDLAGSEPLPAIVRKLVEAITPPLAFDGQELRASVSIGVSIFPDDGDDPDDLIRKADLAMYAAKESGRNTVVFHAQP